MVDYKFNEGALIQELQNYIDDTYDGHYSKNQFQSTEFIIDCGHGMGFALGNVLKYAQRYGKKDGANRKDLMKILHYALIALHQHDLDNPEVEWSGDFSDDFTIDLSNSEDISLSSMYNVDNMDYNSTIMVDVNDGSMTTLTYGNSIDDATPEEWDSASKKAMGNK
jgi:hypothetical protein